MATEKVKPSTNISNSEELKTHQIFMRGAVISNTEKRLQKQCKLMRRNQNLQTENRVSR